MAIKDMTGERFGKLLVVGLYGTDRRHECKWICKCDCGNSSIVYGSHLRKGNTKSCGCEMVRKTHGGSKTRLYRIWLHMKDRCTNPNFDNYAFYGGRGINVCKEWLDFSLFREWAETNGYNDKLSIDRISPDKGYEPSNCRWITMEEQHRNTRKNIIISHNGECHCLSEWARILNIPKNTLIARYNRGEDIFCKS